MVEAKYVQALKAGLIGGVIIGFLTVVNLLVSVVATSSPSLGIVGLVNCCIFLVIIVAMVGVGALAVRMAASVITTLNDAVVVSALSGALSGIISAVVYMITQVVSPWLTSSSNTYSSLYSSYGYSPTELSAYGILGSICCCMPVILVVAVILAIIGGAIYAFAVLKIK